MSKKVGEKWEGVSKKGEGVGQKGIACNQSQTFYRTPFAHERGAIVQFHWLLARQSKYDNRNLSFMHNPIIPLPHPLPQLLIFALSRSFPPVRERLEKVRKRLLRRLANPQIVHIEKQMVFTLKPLLIFNRNQTFTLARPS